MAANKIKFTIIITLLIGSTCFSDTFKHKETSEIFHGFMTQRTNQNKSLVYISEESRYKSLNLAEYEVTIDGLGRNNKVVIVPINRLETLLSKNTAEEVVNSIVKSSNNGPKLIIIEIDSPGGSPEFMKLVMDAIVQTNNCPLVAYITGTTAGGAYSAAAAVAMACDTIYIAPTAEIGVLSPLVSKQRTQTDYDEYINNFNPPSLAAYASFVGTLARNNNRPSVLAMAMLDRTIEVAEVVDTDGTKSFIDKSNRKPSQTITKSLSASAETAPSDETETTEQIRRLSVWTLNANQAIEAGLVDKTADSSQQILIDLGLTDTKVLYTRSIDAIIKRFGLAKQKVTRSLQLIEEYKTNSSQLEQMLSQNQEQLQQFGNIEPYPTDTNVYRTDRTVNRRNDPYRNFDPRRVTSQKEPKNSRFNPLNQQNLAAQQIIVNIQTINQQLLVVLNNMAAEYDQVLSVAQRWPGVLPKTTDIQTLQTELNAVISRINEIMTQS